MGKRLARACVAAALVAPVLLVAEPGVDAAPAPPAARPADGPRPENGVDPADTDGNDLFDSLDDALDGPRSAGDEVSVIVHLDRRPDAETTRGHRRDAGDFDVSFTYDHIDAYAATMTWAQAERLAQRSDVTGIQENGVMRATLDTATAEFGVQEARRDFGTNGNTSGASEYTKHDVVIAVIDTGIDASHPDLDTGKVLAFRDYTNDGFSCGAPSSPTAYDDHGHGTHVASIAAGEGQGSSRAVGVAPGAALVGLKVLNSSGSGSFCDVDNAIQWVIDNKATYGIEIVNLSLGDDFNGDGTDSTSQLVNQAAAAGLVVVVAAGNDGPGLNTVGRPAVAADAITVGNMADPKDNEGFSYRGFRLQSSSSRGPTGDGRTKPDIAAPGVDIYAAVPGGGYGLKTGTSMAAPFVAGVAAQMLHANPSLTPAQVKSNLMSTARDLGAPGTDNDYGAGRLDAHAAVDAVHASSCAGPGVPTHLASATGTLTGTNDENDHTFSVPDTTWPIAVTLTMDGTGTSPVNADMTLHAPGGGQVASSTGATRQEGFAHSPSVTGTYTLRVKSSDGAGNYRYDVSVSPTTGGGSDSCGPFGPFSPPVTVTTTTTTTAPPPTTTTTAPPPPAPAAAKVGGDGYVLIDDKGGLFSFGKAAFLGSVPGLKAANPGVRSGRIMGAFPTHGGAGYIAFDEQGRVFAFGAARDQGSAFDRTGGRVRIVAGFAADGGGYGLVGEDGSVHTFGGAPYHGSVADLRAAGTVGPSRIVSAFSVDGGRGYMLIDNVGGLFSFGSAKFHGSVPDLRNRGVPIGPATVIAGFSVDGGNGYVMIDGIGGLFAFGSAQFHGSVPGLRNAGVRVGPANIVGGFAVGGTGGYVMIDNFGGLFAFGSADFHGSIPGLRASGVHVGPADVVGGFGT